MSLLPNNGFEMLREFDLTVPCFDWLNGHFPLICEQSGPPANLLSLSFLLCLYIQGTDVSLQQRAQPKPIAWLRSLPNAVLEDVLKALRYGRCVVCMCLCMFSTVKESSEFVVGIDVAFWFFLIDVHEQRGWRMNWYGHAFENWNRSITGFSKKWLG